MIGTMKKMKLNWLWGLVLGLATVGSACESNGQAQGPEMGVPAGFSGKSPALPASFVDTSGQTYAWHSAYNVVQSIGNRVRPPEGYRPVAVEKGSFPEWLRGLPLKPGRPDVKLYNGALKGYQDAHHAVIDLDVPPKDLQQCADAVMRLRAEYLFATEQFAALHFNSTSGARFDWERWTQGERPKFYKQGNDWKVSWKQTGKKSATHDDLMAYLEKVYTWAGTASLEKELERVPLSDIQAGDVFIQGGFPGHAVLVVDVAEKEGGAEKLFLLAQSYMPAQEMHVLRNPNSAELSPWYSNQFTGDLSTPEWTFEAENLRRFRK